MFSLKALLAFHILGESLGRSVVCDDKFSQGVTMNDSMEPQTMLGQQNSLHTARKADPAMSTNEASSLPDSNESSEGSVLQIRAV